ncbi:cadherin-like beta sandwich domain-containing protein [Haliangium sp.]|uniref:cadherin-like beta sandwich domain-containing protein n=1 Tax=Haliangium sp. TaxID=2663208 RepID=UPI003D0AF421
MELLSVVADGPFAFPVELRAGDSYAVVFVGAPPCVLAQASGVIAGADPEITLACEGVFLSELELSGPTAPTLTIDPARDEYAADVSALQSYVTVTAVPAHPEATLTIDGARVVAGVASAPLALDLGANIIEVTVTGPGGGARSYSITVRRASDIVQAAYSKASNTGVGDEFGFSVALSGDTLAVGAHLEDSAATSIDGNQADNFASGSGAIYVFRRSGASWAQEAYIKASNTEAEDYFGYSVALAGDTLAVGAPYEDSSSTDVGGDYSNNSAQNSGAVYVFRRSGTTWSPEAYLKASNTDAEDNFGYNVALSGDTLVVSGPYEDSAATGVDGDQDDQDDDAAENSGAVYVFRRTGGVWAQEAYLKASNSSAGDEFGEGIALSGDTLAVAARFEDSAATGVDGDQLDNIAADSGAVYVFHRTGTSWVQEAYLKASNTDAGDSFGEAVALSGDTLAVGARFEDSGATDSDGDQSDNSAADSGAVYVFRRSGTDWSQEAYLKAFNPGAGDDFGISVALSGDTLAVGARFEDSAATGIDGDQGDNSAADSGAVYVFHHLDTTWSLAAYLKASNTEAGDDFGQSLALSGDTLAVDGRLEDSATDDDQGDNSAANSGAVYVFH